MEFGRGGAGAEFCFMLDTIRIFESVYQLGRHSAFVWFVIHDIVSGVFTLSKIEKNWKRVETGRLQFQSHVSYFFLKAQVNFRHGSCERVRFQV